MRLPPKPPRIEEVLSDRPERLMDIMSHTQDMLVGGKYLHWDKLRRYPPPEGLSCEEWWCGLKLRRQAASSQIPLVDVHGQHFRHTLVAPIPERLHQIDQGAGGRIEFDAATINAGTRDRYYVNSLIDEAITSSQLEGAATTRQVAKDMLRSERRPTDRHERMILNNYSTMRKIGSLKDQPLSADLVLELQRLITQDTLDDPSCAGRFRKPEEPIYIGDDRDQIHYTPPPADQLSERMEALCDFANGKTPQAFVHPVIRSIILHFWLAYDHPFVDGNGRTARALFYWSMLRHGFWLFEFITISRIIVEGPSKYSRAFLYTETDDNDLTYFILYHLDVIDQSVKALHEYLARKSKELQATEAQLKGMTAFNHRQRALLRHALRRPHFRYTIASHQGSNNIVYQTARTDLLDLCNHGLLKGQKIGRTWHFTPVPDLEARLSEKDA